MIDFDSSKQDVTSVTLLLFRRCPRYCVALLSLQKRIFLKAARIAYVECNGDSLFDAVPSKVKKCLRACATPIIPPRRLRFQRATDKIKKDSKYA